MHYHVCVRMCTQAFQYDTDLKCNEFPMLLFGVLAIFTLLFFVIGVPILILVSSKKQHSLWILKVNKSQLAWHRTITNHYTS